MALNLPPVPNEPIGETYLWRTWLTRVRDVAITINTNFFTNLNFTGSNLTSIVTRNHNDLTSIQGGAVTDYQHITTAQKTSYNNAVTTLATGVSGTFKSGDVPQKTITVTNGIITSIV